MEHPSEIGSSIVIRGEVTAREDIVVSGRVEGSISAPGCAVTVNTGAHLASDVEARAIVVSGHVLGTMCADEMIQLRPTADVEGELSAPAMVLEDGAVFHGKAETTRTASKRDLQLAS